MSVSADYTYPDGITDEYLINQALMGERGGTAQDTALHRIHRTHCRQARTHRRLRTRTLRTQVFTWMFARTRLARTRILRMACLRRRPLARRTPCSPLGNPAAGTSPC